jgi:signal transduction histidine kinase
VPGHPDPSILGELLGLLAHDLRNPLSALHSNLGYVGSALSPSEVDAHEAVVDGLVSCDGLAHIIDNIDLLGQSLRSTEAPEPSMVDLSTIVEDVVGESRQMARSHGVVVELAPLPADRAMGRGAREPLTRAFANLLRNSIQHSPASSVVHVALREVPGAWSVLVEDSGVPLPTNVRASAFTAPGQVGSKSVPHGRYSRGLGLFCAALSSAAAGATARAIDPPRGVGHAFELVVERW